MIWHLKGSTRSRPVIWTLCHSHRKATFAEACTKAAQKFSVLQSFRWGTWMRFSIIILSIAGSGVMHQLILKCVVLFFTRCQTLHIHICSHARPVSNVLLLCETLQLRGGYLLRHDCICGGGRLPPAVRANQLGQRAKERKGVQFRAEVFSSDGLCLWGGNKNNTRLCFSDISIITESYVIVAFVSSVGSRNFANVL